MALGVLLSLNAYVIASNTMSASESERGELSYIMENIYSLIDFEALCMIAERREMNFSDNTVSKIKRVYDFNDYTYFIIEFSPCGYAIYDNDFTQLLEFNARAQSPYLNYDDGLIYAGATQYYIKSIKSGQNSNLTSAKQFDIDAAVYTHSVLGTEIVMDDDTKIFLKEQSANMAEAIESKKNTISMLEDSYSINAAEATEYYASLRNYTSITNANTTGFNTSGNCGYVAASLIVWYHYDVLGWSDFVPGGRYTISLVEDIQGDRADSTYGPDIQNALSWWSYSHGAVAENRWQETLPALCDLLPASESIYNLIDDDRPVIVLGLVPENPRDFTGIAGTYMGRSANEKVDHAITVTGVVKVVNSAINVDYNYYAHYGWGTAYNDVYISESVITKGAAVYY